MNLKYLLFLYLLFGISSSAFADAIMNNSSSHYRSAIQSSSIKNMPQNDIEQNVQYADAVAEIQNKIKQTPSDYGLYVSLIDLYIRDKSYDKAFNELIFLNNLAKKNKLNTSVINSLKELEKFLSNQERYSRNNNMAVDMAMINLILQNYAKGEQYLEKSTLSPLFTDAYKEFYDTTGNYNAAVNLADKLLKYNPDNINLRKIKANYLIHTNNKTEAVKEFSDLIKVCQDDDELKYTLYKLLTADNVSDKEIIKAFSVKNEENAYSDLANILLKNNNTDEAKKYALDLTKKYPENVNGYIVLSEIYKKEGNIQECYKVLKEVRDKADDSESVAKYNVMLAKLSDVPVKEADSLMNNGLYAQALNVLESSNQENLYVILGMARANYFLDKKQDAFGFLNKAMSLYPNNEDVFYYFAYIFYKENDMESARKYIAKALAINPEHTYSLQLRDVINKNEADTYINKITSYIDTHNYEEAMHLTDEALKIDKKNAKMYYFKGLIYISMNKYAQATAFLYKSIELSDNNPSAYYYLGVAFDNLSEPQNALENYKKYINSLSDDDFEESEKREYAKSRISKLSN